jgi:hypothetical protein
MPRILKQGAPPPVTQVSCDNCTAVLEVGDREWRDGGYGSERHATCPNCGRTVIKPGSKYTGDF